MMPSRGRGGDRRDPARVQLPLLDRLMDDAPDQLTEVPPSPAEAMAALRRAVRRDLEALLNARRRWRSWPQRYRELALSPLGYGIPDFAAGAFNDSARREALRVEIERAIRRFEPRFARVSVSFVDGAQTLDPVLRLRIDALLHAEPAPEPVAFDTVIDAATDEIGVRERTDV